jgi:DNA-binding CsgD family transcriptional regulator
MAALMGSDFIVESNAPFHHRERRPRSAAAEGPVDVCEPLAAILDAVGRTTFYRTVAEQLGPIFGCRKHLVMRYNRAASPVLLVNNFMSRANREFYLEQLCPLHPLHDLALSGVGPRVSTLRTMRGQQRSVQCRNELFERAYVFDELAIVLPLFDGCFIAVCFEHETLEIGSRSIALARKIHPFIERAHRLHLERCLPPRAFGALAGHSIPVLVVADNRPVYKNGAWVEMERSPHAADIECSVRLGHPGKAVPIGGMVLYGHQLGSDNPLCSDGLIYFIARQAPTPTLDITSVLLAAAVEYKLSARERDLFQMALQGRDTRAIADRLCLSVGTVKNYKQRLYAKLNIRSEREMASLLIRFLLRSESGRVNQR